MDDEERGADLPFSTITVPAASLDWRGFPTPLGFVNDDKVNRVRLACFHWPRSRAADRASALLQRILEVVFDQVEEVIAIV
jgi:hypothetical protein